MRNLLRFVRARAHLRTLMTQKLCAIGMRNAKLGNHLKTLNVFFESAFEDLSFHSFLKASDCDFEEKNGCNKHGRWFIEHNFDCS